MNTPNDAASKSALWTAVAHVKTKPGNDMLHGGGAFVAVIVLATDQQDVFAKIRRKLDSYEMMLGRIEDVEPLTQQSRTAISPELLKLGDGLTLDDPVGFGSFHSYPGGDQA